MARVFIVRDKDERYIQGVYRSMRDAAACLEALVQESVAPNDPSYSEEEQKEILRQDYEITVWKLEGEVYEPECA